MGMMSMALLCGRKNYLNDLSKSPSGSLHSPKPWGSFNLARHGQQAFLPLTVHLGDAGRALDLPQTGSY